MASDTIGRYEIRSELGRGGMATVFLAHDPNFDRDVAIKVMPQQFTHDPMFRERFNREARTIASLEHSAIVPVYDFGEENGQPYLVMRYMPGGSLVDRIGQGPLLLKECARIMERLCPALDQAHLRGIIHRDLKPGNILFDQYGEAFLSDFGIAKITETTAALTGSAVIGTPAYMSPEQAYGDKDIDGRSDIYSLGVILFEMLTGSAPYEADTPMGVAMKHILDPVPSILHVKPDLPEDLEYVIGRALAKDPVNRFQTAGEMLVSLMAVARGEPLPIPHSDREAITQAIAAPPQVPTRPAIGRPPVPETANARPETVDLHSSQPPPAPDTHAPAWTGIGSVTSAAQAPADQPAMPPPTAARQRRNRVATLIVLALLVVVVWRGGCGLLENISKSRTQRTTQADMPASAAESNMSTYSITQALEEDIDALEVTVTLRNGRAEIGALEGSVNAVEGSYVLPVGLQPFNVTYEQRSRTGILTIIQPEEGITDENTSLVLNLTSEVPIDLVVKSGFGQSTLDLEQLNLRSLRMEGGASTTTITLPSHAEDLEVSIQGGAGDIKVLRPQDDTALLMHTMTIFGGLGQLVVELPSNGGYDVEVTTGIGEITIRVPEALEALIDFEGLASLEVINTRFIENENGDWQTTGYEAAESWANIQINAFVGSVKITD